MENYIQILKSSYLLCSSSDEDIRYLLENTNPIVKEYEKDEFILRTSEVTEHFGIVLQGQLQIIKEDYFTGKKMILTELSKADIFAEVYAYLGNVPLEVSVLTSTLSKVMFIDMKKLIEICNRQDRFNGVLDNLLKTLAFKNLTLTEKIEHISKRQIKERLLSYLTTQSIKHSSRSFTIPFDRQELADYLCVDRSALSKEIGILNRKGIIQSNKNRFTILEM